MTEGKITGEVQSRRFSLIKPSLQLSFLIVFVWLQKNERDWHVCLRCWLCP